MPPLSLITQGLDVSANQPPAAPTTPAWTNQVWPPNPVTVASARRRPPSPAPYAWTMLVAGLASLGFSLLPMYYTLTVTITLDAPFSTTQNYNAWYGLFGWLGSVLLVLAGVVAIIKVISHSSKVGWAYSAMVVSLLGLASTVVAHFIYPAIDNPSFGDDVSKYATIDGGFGVGYAFCLLCALCSALPAVLFAVTKTPAQTPSVPQATPAQGFGQPIPQPGFSTAPRTGAAAPTYSPVAQQPFTSPPRQGEMAPTQQPPLVVKPVLGYGQSVPQQGFDGVTGLGNR